VVREEQSSKACSIKGSPSGKAPAWATRAAQSRRAPRPARCSRPPAVRSTQAQAGVLLTFLALLPLAIMSMVVSMELYYQPVAVAPAALFSILSALSLGMLAWHLRGVREISMGAMRTSESAPSRNPFDNSK